MIPKLTCQVNSLDGKVLSTHWALGTYHCETLKNTALGFPGGAVVENLPANAGDMGSSPGLGRSHMPWSN